MTHEEKADPKPLAAAFETVSLDQWREKVGEPAAGGMPRTMIEDSIELPWLYTPSDALAADPAGLVGEAPFVRGSARDGWDIRQERSAAAPEVMAAQIVEDLEGGATSATVIYDAATRARHAAGSADFSKLVAVDGLSAPTIDALDRALADVKLDLAPLSLRAGASAVEAAAQLVALWQRRGHDLAAVEGSLGVDPIGALAAEGAAESEIGQAVEAAGRLAFEADKLLGPGVKLLRADASVYGEAGASPALELALLIATGAAYLRAAEAAGLEPAAAAGRIELVLSVGPDQFLEIARLRAARRLWARVLELSGVPEEARRSSLVARANARRYTAVDPWVNMLRATTLTFAAAVGGADAISVAGFDLARGNASALGRRIARNTQLILMEESSLGQVVDPAGGSWYVEDLTDKLSRAAWQELSEIESAGGVAKLLGDDTLRDRIGQQVEARRARVVTRQTELTGVNAFPLLGDDGFESEPAPDRTPLLAAAEAADASPVEPAASFSELVERAAAGASLAQLASARGVGQEARVSAEPLGLVRASEPFEELRRAAADAAAAPSVFLACLGSNAEHNVAATWAVNFFGAGGIRAEQSQPLLDPAEAGSAFAASGAKIAAVSAGRKAEAADVAAAVAALKQAGAARVYLAPGSDDAAAAAGADVALTDGVDMYKILSEALEACGVRRGVEQ